MLGYVREQLYAIGRREIDGYVATQDDVECANRGSGFEQILTLKRGKRPQLVADGPVIALGYEEALDAIGC
jgi:hypothetical protein